MKSVVSADATHYLHCRHCIGPSCRSYVMKAIVLKDMGDGRVKLLVFGDRHWRDMEHVKRVRYVEKDRVSRITTYGVRK